MLRNVLRIDRRCWVHCIRSCPPLQPSFMNMPNPPTSIGYLLLQVAFSSEQNDRRIQRRSWSRGIVSRRRGYFTQHIQAVLYLMVLQTCNIFKLDVDTQSSTAQQRVPACFSAWEECSNQFSYSFVCPGKAKGRHIQRISSDSLL